MSAMLRHWAGAACLVLAMAPGHAQSGAEASNQSELTEARPAQIVVTGRRPGPGLWKVSKDDHVMWVFGLYSPLPQDMEWDPSRTERLIAGAQELVMPPSMRAKLRWYQGFSVLGAVPSLIGIRKNPDGATLRDVLPAETHARWLALKAKYIGKDEDVEFLRPIFAAEQLTRAARIKNGLSTADKVREQIVQIATQNQVKLVSTGFDVPLKDVGKKIRAFKQSRLDDVACFTRTLDDLEGDLDAMRARANAWANGKAAEIRELDFARRTACVDAVLNSSVAADIDDVQAMPERLRDAWLLAAEKALATNASSFAMLDMKDIVGPKSYLADLQARGYTVESPK